MQTDSHRHTRTDKSTDNKGRLELTGTRANRMKRFITTK